MTVTARTDSTRDWSTGERSYVTGDLSPSTCYPGSGGGGGGDEECDPDGPTCEEEKDPGDDGGGLLSLIATGKVKTTGYAIQRSVPEGSPYSLAVAEYT